MRAHVRLTAVIVAMLFNGSLPVHAADAAATVPVAGYYGLVGSWKGEGIAREGAEESHFNLHLNCDKASDGWAVLCTLNGRDAAGNLLLAETDLFGVDPATGNGHWYAVTNTGETHDHQVSWSDPHTLQAHLDWEQEGRQMQERITFDLSGAGSLLFRSVLSANGQDVSVFTGTLYSR